jgi:hypothetical protein
MQSECMPWRTLALVQLSPSSRLIMTPWPMVPTRMVPFFAMVHPLRSCGRSRLLRWRLYARRRAAATRSRYSHARRASYAGLAPFVVIAVFPVDWMAITAFPQDADPSRMDQVPFWFHLAADAQELKEGKAATHWTHLSCHRFRANEVRLLPGLTAYNLGNLLRWLVLPVAIQSWSLTSLQNGSSTPAAASFGMPGTSPLAGCGKSG